VDLDVAVPEGRVAALVGPNGAGKTTLIRCWAGFERPNSGTVRVHGQDPARRSADQPRVAVVAQQPALYPTLPVDYHLGLAAQAVPTFDRPATLARLERHGIEARRTAGSLSGGQRAQLSLSLALGLGAKVLLLDEPTASLDPLARREFLEELGRLRDAQGTTILLSSHVLGELADVCDWLILIGQGRLAIAGDIETILAEHAVADPDTIPQARAIGPLPGAAGGKQLVRLEAGGPEPPQARRATLDDVVLGYLGTVR
jgi:ABC-2 type transport system ATP-binding protein